jgi:hypothetical protein
LQRQPALPVDEIKRAFTFDFLEPEIGIIVGRGDGRPVVDCHGLNSRMA